MDSKDSSTPSKEMRLSLAAHPALSLLAQRSLEDSSERTAVTNPMDESFNSILALPMPLPSPSPPPQAARPGAFPVNPLGRPSDSRQTSSRSITIGDSMRNLISGAVLSQDCLDDNSERLAKLQAQRKEQSLAMAQMRQRLTEMEQVEQELSNLRASLPKAEPVKDNSPTTQSTSISDKDCLWHGDSFVVRPKHMSDQEWNAYQILIGAKDTESCHRRPRFSFSFGMDGTRRRRSSTSTTGQRKKWRIPSLRRPRWSLPMALLKK